MTKAVSNFIHSVYWIDWLFVLLELIQLGRGRVGFCDYSFSKFVCKIVCQCFDENTYNMGLVRTYAPQIRQIRASSTARRICYVSFQKMIGIYWAH